MSCQNSKIIRIQSDKSVYQYVLPYTEQISSIELVNWCIYNSSYIINNNNNTFVFTVGSTRYSVTIPQGNYTSSGLATVLQTQLNNITGTTGITWSITDVSSRMKYQITTNASVTINWSQMPFLSSVLGFRNVDLSGSSFVSDGVYQVTTTPFYYIVIKEIPSTNISKYNNFTVLYNNVASGSLLTRDIASHTYGSYFKNKTSLSSITVEIRDKDYQLIEMNGVPWMLEFQITM